MVKSYYLSQMFKVDWMTAYAFCKDNDMTLVTLSDAAEMSNFLNICGKNYKKFNGFVEFHIGGFKPTSVTSTTNWYWYDTGAKIDYKIPWHVDEPNNDQSTENCMSFIEGNWGQGGGEGTYFINDCHCYNMYSSFVCQDIKPQ